MMPSAQKPCFMHPDSDDKMIVKKSCACMKPLARYWILFIK